MDIKEKIVSDYFKSWIDNDLSIIENNFSEEIHYIESWGPAYKGINEVKRWFSDWHKNSQVLKWDIKDSIVIDDRVICEWYFKHKHNDNSNNFNGVSIIKFDEKNKVVEVKEFMSVLPIKYPYNN